MFFTLQEINIKGSPKATQLLEDFFGPEESQWAKEAPEGLLEVSSIHQGAPGGPSAPWGVVPTSDAPRTASLLYKYHNIPETLEQASKY